MALRKYNSQNEEGMKDEESRNFKPSDAMRRVSIRGFSNEISEEPGDLAKWVKRAYDTIPKKVTKELREAKD